MSGRAWVSRTSAGTAVGPGVNNLGDLIWVGVSGVSVGCGTAALYGRGRVGRKHDPGRASALEMGVDPAPQLRLALAGDAGKRNDPGVRADVEAGQRARERFAQR